MPQRRSHAGVWVFIVFLLTAVVITLFATGVISFEEPPDPNQEYNLVYESAAEAVHSKNPSMLFTVLSTNSRNKLAALLPLETRLNSSIQEKSDASTLLDTALKNGAFNTLFPADDKPESFKELEGGQVSITTLQGKKFWLAQEDEKWKMELDPNSFGYNDRRYTALDGWDKVVKEIKEKNGAAVYDLLTKDSQIIADKEAQNPTTDKSRKKSGKKKPVFKDGKELLSTTFESEDNGIPDVANLKIQKLDLKGQKARFTLPAGSVIELIEENGAWKLNLLCNDGPPVALLGPIALLATGKEAPAEKPQETTEKTEGTTSEKAPGKYSISGTATTSGDRGGGRSPMAIADKINGGFYTRVQAGLISAYPSKEGTATATFTIDKDGSVYRVSVTSANGELNLIISSVCRGSHFPASEGETKATYRAIVTK